MTGTSTVTRILTIAFAAVALAAPAAVANPGYVLERTWGGTPGPEDGQFSHAAGVATDASGHVYLADPGNHRVQKFTSTGEFVLKWGSYGEGNGQFVGPGVVATDAAGNVYAGDSTRIQKFTSSGGFITAWGRFGEGDGQFAYITDIATDASGNVYVTDHYYDSVQKFSSSGRFIGKWTNLVPEQPGGIAIDGSGNVYVAGTDEIVKFTSNGDFLRQWRWDSPGHDWRFGEVAVDASGAVFATRGHVVLSQAGWADNLMVSSVDKFDSSGSPLTDWVVSSRRCGDSWWCLPGPDVLDVDRFGNVYVASFDCGCMKKFAPTQAPQPTPTPSPTPSPTPTPTPTPSPTPTPTPSPVGCAVTNGGDVQIADLQTVESLVTVTGCPGNAPVNATVEVHIAHTYIGDLIVRLVAPDGSSYLLHNRAGGSADDINQTYTVNLSAKAANGTWKLRVQDAAGGDVGRIDSWTINLGSGPSPTPSPSPSPGPARCAATNGTDVQIPDLTTVESPITITDCPGNASATATVEVHIAHTYIGDLNVTLLAPDGSTYPLHNRAGGSTENIDQTYTVNLSSEPQNGTWKLRVQDAAAADVGRIDSWTIAL